MKERRQHPRYPARWRVVIHCHCHHDRKQKAFDGLTSDVSLGGMCVHSTHNLCTTRDMDITLIIPPMQVGGPAHRLTIRGRTGHTVLVGEADVFRTGVQFTSMSPEDLNCLRHHLETRFGFYPLGKSGSQPGAAE